ncbi:MAG: protoporphyrinogen oxidase [Candidatus Eremiobacteraeota bacterium]|nr:protoporphyrinogen oxidase [Candidatus Eremiobacteraeota bacterium]
MSEEFEPIDIAVVGGGISGLACAFWAKKKGRSVALFEASANVGGSITTLRSGRYIADGGPQSFVASEALTQLVHDAELDQFVLRAAPAAATPYLYHHGRLVQAPRSPRALLGTPLLSAFAKLRILGEPLAGASTVEDESVAAFTRRRAGSEVLDALVGPFVSGIFAGDPEKLSLRSAFPSMATLEREHGSILRGAARMKARGNGQRPPAQGSARTSIGFRGGNDLLPRALAAHLGPDFSVNANVEAMWQRGQWMELLVTGQPNKRVIAKTIVLATPAPETADLLDSMESKAATALRGIEYPPVVQIALAYPRSAVGMALDGFGFLASRREDLRILGCVYNSAMYPDRCPPDEVLLTAFLGGATDRAAAAQSDDELAKVAHKDIARALRIKDVAPHVVAGFRWQQAIPQYNVGHAQRLAIVEQCLSRLPQVRLCGNYLRGPSVSDCLKLARETADSF